MRNTPLNIPQQKKAATGNYKPKKDKSYNYIVFAVLCFFVGFGLSIAFYSYVLIDIVTLSKFIAAFAVIGFLIPLKLYRKWFDFIKYEMIIFNIIGIAPILTGLFLIIFENASCRIQTRSPKHWQTSVADYLSRSTAVQGSLNPNIINQGILI